MNLKEDLLRGIYGYGFEAPSRIQQQAIRPLAFGQGAMDQTFVEFKLMILLE